MTEKLPFYLDGRALPDRITLLAIAEAADQTADQIDPPPRKARYVGGEVVLAQIGNGWRQFAAALRAKAG